MEKLTVDHPALKNGIFWKIHQMDAGLPASGKG